MTEYAVKVAAPVPPPATGNPVQFVSTPEAGVPKAGVTKAGDVAKTNAPVPVFVVATADKRLALVGVASHVATPEPNPVIAPTGSPVQFVKVPEVGVPSKGVTKVGLVAKTKEPEPVEVVATAEAKFALVGEASHVATPVPNPDMPDDTGNPVQFVNVPLVGVPRTGVVNEGDVVPANEPVPLCPDSDVLTALFVATD